MANKKVKLTISLDVDADFGKEVEFEAVDGEGNPVSDEHAFVCIANALRLLSDSGKISDVQKHMARFFWMPVFISSHPQEDFKIQDEALSQFIRPIHAAVGSVLEGAPSRQRPTRRISSRRGL